MQYLALTADRGEIDWGAKGGLLKEEAFRVLELHRTGVLRNIWFTERRDAVLILEAPSRESAIESLESLPLVRAGLIGYVLRDLLPYDGLDRIVGS